MPVYRENTSLSALQNHITITKDTLMALNTKEISKFLVLCQAQHFWAPKMSPLGRVVRGTKGLDTWILRVRL